jgi:YgiT-type zinc finger domain-containing protein
MSVRVRLSPVSSPLRLVTANEPFGSPAPGDGARDAERLNETLPWIQPRPASLAAGPQARCIRCEGQLAPGRAPVHLERPGYRLAWEGLPAWVCSRCEASYFEEREVHLIRRTLDLMRRLAIGPHA